MNENQSLSNEIKDNITISTNHNPFEITFPNKNNINSSVSNSFINIKHNKNNENNKASTSKNILKTKPIIKKTKIKSNKKVTLFVNEPDKEDKEIQFNNSSESQIIHELPLLSIGSLENSKAQAFSTYSLTSTDSYHVSKMNVECFFVEELKKNITLFSLFSGIKHMSSEENINNPPKRHSRLLGSKDNLRNYFSSDDKIINDDELNSSANDSELNDSNASSRTSKESSIHKENKEKREEAFPKMPKLRVRIGNAFTNPALPNIEESVEKKHPSKKSSANNFFFQNEKGRSTPSEVEAKRIIYKKLKQKLIDKRTKLEKKMSISQQRELPANSKYTAELKPKENLTDIEYQQINDKANIKSNLQYNELTDFTSFANSVYSSLLISHLKLKIQPNQAMMNAIADLMNLYLNNPKLKEKNYSKSLIEKIHEEITLSICLIIDEYLWVAVKGNSRVVASLKEGEEIYRLSSLLVKNKSDAFLVNNYTVNSNKNTVEVNAFRIPPDLDFIFMLDKESINKILNKEFVSSMYQALLKEIDSLEKEDENQIEELVHMQVQKNTKESAIYRAMKIIFNGYMKNENIPNFAYGVLLMKNFTDCIDKQKISTIKSIINRLNLSLPAIDNNDIYPHLLENDKIQYEFNDTKMIKKTLADLSTLSSKKNKSQIKEIYNYICCCCFKKKEKIKVAITSDSKINCISSGNDLKRRFNFD